MALQTVDIDDGRLRVKVATTAPGFSRLTLDFPQEQPYVRRVMAALSDFLRPTDENLLPTQALQDQTRD
jgi:hypothetical protein